MGRCLEKVLKNQWLLWLTSSSDTESSLLYHPKKRKNYPLILPVFFLLKKLICDPLTILWAKINSSTTENKESAEDKLSNAQTVGALKELEDEFADDATFEEYR